jgi:outer membrane protein OmpA-like peptidoglycan-associated protein
MRRFFFLINFAAVFFSFCNGQGHGSCDRAAIVDTSVYGPVYADGGADPQLAMQHTNGMYFEKPHAVVWFCIDIPYDTILTFDLIPQKPTDDLDFLLFKDVSFDKNCAMCRTEKQTFCQLVEGQRITPIRTNLARCDNSVNGRTGLSLNAKNTMELPGQHPTYSKAVEVKKGERYYLAVDNYTRADGPFTLRLHFRYINQSESVITGTVPDNAMESNIQNKNPQLMALLNGSFVINVLDSTTKNPVKARIKITGPPPDGVPHIDITDNQYKLTVKAGEKLNIVCAAKGYLLYQTDYTAQTDSDKGIDVFLVPIREHQKMIFHIEFQPGSSEFMASAAGPLNDLLQFMKDNPGVKIVVNGYVNDPYSNYDQAFDLKLSQIRAKAVYQFLTDNGIKLNRLHWKGYSNKGMVYPHPVSEEQMQANRRVEVEIVK